MKQYRKRINSVWWGMLYRCYNETGPAYKDYGGRGIIICDEWKNSFDNFYEWAIKSGYTQGLTIDRYPNNDGNYEPSNCRWATYKEQATNKRKRLSKLTRERSGFIDICKEKNIKYPTLHSRIQRGMPLDKAIGYVDNRVNDPRISKPILQYDMNMNLIAEYPSIKEITRVTNFKKPNIIHHLKGRQNRSHAYGFIWKYKQ